MQGLGLCVGAWLIGVPHTASDKLGADARDFDASPSCRENRVITDAPQAPLERPLQGECVVQSVTVINKHYEYRMGRGSGRGAEYTITVLWPWGGRHAFILRGDKHAYDSVEVNRPANALLYGQRIAFLAVDGRPISTTDDPDVDHLVQVLRWVGAVVLLAGGLFSFYRAAKSGLAESSG